MCSTWYPFLLDADLCLRSDHLPNSCLQASPNHTVAGQPLLPAWVPDEWYPELKQSPGTPLHPCTYDSVTQTFRREWSGVSVSLNMADETADIRWK